MAPGRCRTGARHLHDTPSPSAAAAPTGAGAPAPCARAGATRPARGRPPRARRRRRASGRRAAAAAGGAGSRRGAPATRPPAAALAPRSIRLSGITTWSVGGCTMSAPAPAGLCSSTAACGAARSSSPSSSDRVAGVDLLAPDRRRPRRSPATRPARISPSTSRRVPRPAAATYRLSRIASGSGPATRSPGPARRRSPDRSRVTSVGRRPCSIVSRLITHFATSRARRQLEHHVEQRVLDDRAQAAGAGLALERLVGDRPRARPR